MRWTYRVMIRSESASNALSVGWWILVSTAVVSVRSFLSGDDGRRFGLLHDPLVDLLSAFLAKERKAPTQIAKIGNRIS